MKYIIVDDEPIAHDIIEEYAGELDDMELVGKCYNAIEAISLLQKKEVDLIFLDIEMPKLKGLDFLRTLSNPPLVVITTAYSEFAVESYELTVTDYLLKPFGFDRFLKAYTKVKKAKEQADAAGKSSPVKEATSKSVFLKGDKEIYHIKLDDILYLESYGNYVKVHVGKEVLLIHETLSNMESTLPSEQFLRVHRSFMIQISCIDRITGNQIKIGDATIPIGRSYKAIVNNRLF
ncbi:response regulator [Leptobacterium flavescens]|uniref:Response regulator n=1 Tax=Leptobacterium flavescens TaxID=472055 RepID=A0A6P0UPV0_9FLAO|nr:LytTR family DNA-binding domain-containing protein [Leptobacterium flavescens]NER14500.1 response regulator [Leptobacterium flavescens]